MENQAPFSVFGKLPAHPDFLQLGENSTLLNRFADWLTESVEWAHARAGEAFREAFRASGIRAFVFASAAANGEIAPIIGVLAPSHDAAGRLFPLSVAACPAFDREFGGQPHLLPLACEDIWESAGQCLVDLLGNPEADPSAYLSRLPAQPVQAFSDAHAGYAAWSRELQLSELWQLISGSPQSEGLREILRWVVEAVRPHRQQEPSNTRLALRLPLGQAGGAAVCFWLDVVRRLIAWRRTVPTFFWSHDGTSGALTLHLGQPALSSIAELWLPSHTRDEVCDLTAIPGGPSNADLPPLPVAIEQALSSAPTVADLLLRLSEA